MKSLTKDITRAVKIAVIAGVLVLGATIVQAQFTGPTDVPPGDNTPEPVNVGTSFQEKLGDLWVDTFGSDNGVSTSQYCFLDFTDIDNPAPIECITGWPGQDSDTTVIASEFCFEDPDNPGELNCIDSWPSDGEDGQAGVSGSGGSDQNLRFTRANVAYNALVSDKDAACAAEYGVDYQVAQVLDVVFHGGFVGIDNSAIDPFFNTLEPMAHSFDTNEIGDEPSSLVSWPLACVRKTAPLLLSRTHVSFTLPDSSKDNTCILEYGGDYEAATHLDLAPYGGREAVGYSGSQDDQWFTFNVAKLTTKSLFSDGDSSIAVFQSTTGRTEPVACIRNPQGFRTTVPPATIGTILANDSRNVGTGPYISLDGQYISGDASPAGGYIKVNGGASFDYALFAATGGISSGAGIPNNGGKVCDSGGRLCAQMSFGNIIVSTGGGVQVNYYSDPASGITPSVVGHIGAGADVEIGSQSLIELNGQWAISDSSVGGGYIKNNGSNFDYSIFSATSDRQSGVGNNDGVENCTNRFCVRMESGSIWVRTLSSTKLTYMAGSSSVSPQIGVIPSGGSISGLTSPYISLNGQLNNGDSGAGGGYVRRNNASSFDYALNYGTSGIKTGSGTNNGASHCSSSSNGSTCVSMSAGGTITISTSGQSLLNYAAF